QAADYSLAYGIELNGIRDTGVQNECNTRQLCKISDTRGEVVILVSINHVDDPLAFLSILGRRRDCCFFNGGSENTFVDASKPSSTICTFSSDERRLRGARRMVFTIRSDDDSGCTDFVSSPLLDGYDEPEILPSSTR